jgi:hypothetical protein
LRIDPVRRAGRRLHAEQERGLGARCRVVEKAPLTQERDVAEPGGIAAVVDRVADDTAVPMRVMAFADVVADHPGHAHRHHEVVRDAVRGSRDRGLDRADAVRVDVLAGGVDQLRIAEPAELDVLVHERNRAMSGFQRRRRDREERPGAAGVRGAARMVSERG